jgi:hypothetical protein
MVAVLFYYLCYVKKSFRYILSAVVLAILPMSLQAQTDEPLLEIQLETAGIAGGGDHAPFWHTSNRQGLPSVKSSNGYARIAALGGVHRPSGFGVDYGVDLGAGAGLENSLFVHQLYADLDYRWLGMSIGMKERWSDKNRYLSTGALTWSGNSKPIPEVRAGIPEFVRIPFTGGWFFIKGHIGYGRMTDDKWRTGHGGTKYVDGVLFHSKSAFLRFGDEERFPLQVTLGLEMNNLFGGTLYSGNTVKEMPSDATAFWTVLFPFHQVEQQGNEDGDNLGSWHLNFDYKLQDWHIGAYYEHFYEDHSSWLGIEYKNNTQGEKDFIFFGFRRNWFDGLFGIEVNAPDNIRFFRNAVVEFMNTRGLCGPICHSAACNTDGMYVIEEVDGRDGMYNHGIYSSYTHHGYAIGNPVLVSPVYNADNSNRFRSNRVQMFHLGVDGGITDNIDYRLLATTTRHWGCYGAPLKDIERVTSIMLECSYRMGDRYDWKFSLSGAMDIDSGSLIGDNKGVMLTISKFWKVL